MLPDLGLIDLMIGEKRRVAEPRVWEHVLDIIGTEAATCLSIQFGGARLYIPQRAGPDHRLTLAIGQKAADEIIAAMAGDYLDVPHKLARDARIVQLRTDGRTVAQISAAVGCSRRTVQSVLAAKRAA